VLLYVFNHHITDKYILFVFATTYSLTIFFAWAAVFWFWWPIKLLDIDTKVEAKKTSDGTTDENTRLVGA